MASDPYKYFRVEAREIADKLSQGLLELERSDSGGEIVSELLRLAHTLKGAARVVRQPEIAEHTHLIEEALTPFRDIVGTVPRENIDAILRFVDGITNRVAILQMPEPAAKDGASLPVKSTPVPEEISRAVRTDVDEIDSLLNGVTETYTQLCGLRDVAVLAEKARRLSEHIAGRLAVAAREIDRSELGRIEASAEILCNLAGQLERGIAGTHERVDRELRQVRDAADQLRLVPAGSLFAKFERAARDSAQALGKEVFFEGAGGDIRLDAQVIQVVQDAVLQIVRNAVAHGIETRPDRIAANKPEMGKIGVTVFRRGRQIVFRCEDDGRGIDVASLREAAIRKGRSVADLDQLDTNSKIRALLQGGISTSTVISEVAGRGIGMDIVRAAVAKLAADFTVATVPGKGTSFDLIVPLSVSSVEALVVEGTGVIATIPLHAVRRTMRIEAHDIHHTSLGEAIVHGEGVIPLVSLARLLGQSVSSRPEGSFSAVIITAPTGLAAVSVDQLLGISNIVFHSLSELAPTTSVVAGASLDADGSPLLMLDPEGIVAMAMHTSELQVDREGTKHRLLVIDDSLTTRMLEQSILESAGYDVDLAISGEEGFELARHADYALFLVDVEMPGMDGFTFIEQIRRDPKLSRTPAILVTSLNTPEDKRRGHDAGAQGYVVKSDFDQVRLIEHIKQLVA